MTNPPDWRDLIAASLPGPGPLTQTSTFLTPKSLMDALDKINPDMNFEEKKGNPLSVCLSFSLSFSIPIITICAMNLLMIIINLLNFFLRWMP